MTLIKTRWTKITNHDGQKLITTMDKTSYPKRIEKIVFLKIVVLTTLLVT